MQVSNKYCYSDVIAHYIEQFQSKRCIVFANMKGIIKEY